MAKEYDFSKAERGTVVPQKGKTRTIIYIGNGNLEEFRHRSDESGRGYQTMMKGSFKGERSRTPSKGSNLAKYKDQELGQPYDDIYPESKYLRPAASISGGHRGTCLPANHRCDMLV